MKKKIILQLFLIIVVLSLIIDIIIAYNFRQNGISVAVRTAKSISEVIKVGLTSHAINENMHQKDIFINSVNDMPEIDNIKITPSKAVSNEYQTLFTPNEIEKEVLTSGKMKYFIEENLFDSNAVLKISIPFKAKRENNCISCHNVQYGEVLGVMSFDMNISDIKNSSFALILLIFFVTLLAIILGTLIASNILNPYAKILQRISISIKHAINGNFITIKKPNKIEQDLNEFIDNYNTLVINYKDTFDDIDKKLKDFIVHTPQQDLLSPLEESKQIIDSLSNLFKFKKEIEKVSAKEDVINKLIDIIQTEFGQKNFTIFEIDNEKNTRKVINQIGNPAFCSCSSITNLKNCKGLKIQSDTFTKNFKSDCPCFSYDKLFHFCTSVNINDKTRISINFVVETIEEFEALKTNMPFIKNYLQEATPSIKIIDLLKELKESAFKDSLTGLYNRKYLNEYIKTALPQTLRENKKLAILMIDIDHFKSINDKYGHNVGDIVLKQISNVLHENIRESDLLARFGGEEFIVILNNIGNIQGALKVANKINKQAEQYNIYINEEEGSFKRTISIGVAMFPDNGDTFDNVLKNADIALYKAKRNGRNQVVLFNEATI